MKNFNLSVVNSSSETVHGELGISDERKDQILKTTADIISGENDNGEVVCKVFNAFDEPSEAVFAVFAITQLEEKLMIQEQFQMAANLEESTD